MCVAVKGITLQCDMTQEPNEHQMLWDVMKDNLLELSAANLLEESIVWSMFSLVAK